MEGENATVEFDVEELAKRVDSCIAKVADAQGEVFELSEQVKEALEAFYSGALKHMVRTIRSEVSSGDELLRVLARDPGIRTLFLLTGIIRPGPSESVERVLASLGTVVQKSDVHISVEEVSPPLVRLAIKNRGSGLQPDFSELAELVTEAILGAVEEIEEVEFIEAPVQETFVSIGPARRAPKWQRGPCVKSFGDSKIQAFEAFNTKMIAVYSAGVITCFENRCAHLGMPLDRAEVDEEGTLRCPWHGMCFDIASGECVSMPSLRLIRVRSRVTDGFVEVRRADHADA